AGDDREHLVAERMQHDADPVVARDADRPLRQPEQVVDRAVEGVDDPAQPGRSRDVGALLAEDPVVGATAAEDREDGALGLAVRCADEVGRRALGLDALGAAGGLEAIHEDGGRGPRRLEGDVEEVLAHSGGRRSAHGRAPSIWAASESSVASSRGRPASWTASGRPSPSNPAGTEHAGWPVALNAP